MPTATYNPEALPDSVDIPMPETLSGDPLPFDHPERDNLLGTKRTAQALISLSGEVAYQQAHGNLNYDPYDKPEDDPDERLEFVMVERDVDGNVIKVVKPDPKIINYDHRSKRDDGAQYEDGSTAWEIDNTLPALPIASLSPRSGDSDASILPFVHGQDRGKRISTGEAEKPHQLTFMHTPKYEGSVSVWKKIAGRVDPRTGRPNEKFYVSARRRAEMLYGSLRHPNKRMWKIQSNEAIYNTVLEDLKNEPQIPMTMNYAQANRAKPYRADGETGRKVAAQGELSPNEFDYTQIKINKFLEHLPKDTPAEVMQHEIERLRSYAMNYLEALSRGDHATLNQIYDVDLNKYLKFEEATEQTGPDGAKVWLAEKMYAYIEKRLIDGGFEEAETKTLTEVRKVVEETSHYGPDDKYRILFSIQNSNGVWVRSDTNKPLEHAEVMRVEELWKDILKNQDAMAAYQARAAYEITKQPPYLQAIFWQRLINIQLERGFTPQQVALVMIGLQYANKPLYLSFKHRDMVHPLARDAKGDVIFENAEDEKGNPIYEDAKYAHGERKGETIYTNTQRKNADGSLMFKMNKSGTFDLDSRGNKIPIFEAAQVQKRQAKYDKNHIIIGPLHMRKWITEAAHRIPVHGMRFESPEIKSMVDIAMNVGTELDRSFYIPGYAKGAGYTEEGYKRSPIGRLSEEFLDALYCLKGMRAMAANMVMGLQADSGDMKPEDMARIMQAETAYVLGAERAGVNRNGPNYPPRIASSSLPHENLQVFCDLVNSIAERYPIAAKPTISDKGIVSRIDRPVGVARR